MAGEGLREGVPGLESSGVPGGLVGPLKDLKKGRGLPAGLLSIELSAESRRGGREETSWEAGESGPAFPSRPVSPALACGHSTSFLGEQCPDPRRVWNAVL